MKARELLEKVIAGETVSCEVTGKDIPAEEFLKFVFKKGKLAPRMENAEVQSIVSVEAQIEDPLIKVEPRGPDVKFVQGDEGDV